MLKLLRLVLATSCVISIMFTCSPGICSIKYISERKLPHKHTNVCLFNEEKILLPDPFTKEYSEFLQPPYGVNEDGILYYNYGNRYNNLGNYSNPTYVAAYANALYNEVLLGNKNYKTNFFKQVDYLLSTANVDPDGGLYWTYPFENLHYNTPKGWYSAMTSGRILGVLVRAHSLSKNKKYLEAARNVYKKLSKPLKNSGMVTYSKKNEAWLETVAYPQIDSFKVLNGHIFALAGLNDYALYINDRQAKMLTKKAINAVRNHLDDYDAGYTSYYSMKIPSKGRPYAERLGYNSIHVCQLLYCYLIDGAPAFLRKAMRFQLYEVFTPEIKATFTTNPQKNGTDKMNLTFGNNYWSSYRFPVSVTMDFKEKITMTGISIIGHSEKSSPRNFKLYKSNDSLCWKEISAEISVDGKIQDILFKKPEDAQYLKCDIFSDNGNGAVALDGIGIHRKRDDLSPIFISNDMYCNAKIFEYNTLLPSLLDKRSDTAVILKAKDDVNLIIPCKGKEIILKGSFRETKGELSIFCSRDLATWTPYSGKVFLSDDMIRLYPEAGFMKINIKIDSNLRIYELNY